MLGLFPKSTILTLIVTLMITANVHHSANATVFNPESFTIENACCTQLGRSSRTEMRGRARDTGPRSRVAKGAGARDCVPRLDAERILRVVREGARQQGHLLLAVDSASAQHGWFPTLHGKMPY